MSLSLRVSGSLRWWVPLIAAAMMAGGWKTSASEAGESRAAGLPFSRAELRSRTFLLAREYFRDFRHPQTHVVYGARLATKEKWPSPADVRAGRPKPWGYGSRMADTALHSGHLLVALLEAHQARPDPFLEKNIRKTFAALRLIGSLPERFPKPGLTDLVGVVPRGPHPDDLSAYYDDSSMDQHTTFILALALFARSPLATAEDKAWIRQMLQKVGRRLERHGWSIKRGDGVTRAHVGFPWTGFNADHASILLPALLALHRGTNDPHWKRTYERMLAERNGLRWKLLQPGAHLRINAHPIYANQNAFRIHALYELETNPRRRSVLRKLLRQIAVKQCGRDFPGPFYQKFHSEAQWSRLRTRWGWPGRHLHGCAEAWRLFRPEMLDHGGLPELAHVRFPLGGMHTVLLSEDAEMIRSHLPQIWQMLTTVDLRKLRSGETAYLLVVVALHTYAFAFQDARAGGGLPVPAPAPAEIPKRKETVTKRNAPFVSLESCGPLGKSSGRRPGPEWPKAQGKSLLHLVKLGGGRQFG